MITALKQNRFLKFLFISSVVYLILYLTYEFVVKKYSNDPLVFDSISSKMGIELIEFGAEAVQNAAKLSLPTLLFHGTADQLTSYNDSKKFAANAGKNVKFITYDGFYHECHNEP